MAADPSLFLSPPDPPSPPDRSDRSAEATDQSSPRPRAAAREGSSRRRLAAAVVVGALLVAAVAANRVSSRDGTAPEGAPPTILSEDDGPATATGPHGRATTTATPAVQTSARLGPLLPVPTGTTVAVVSHDRVVLADLDSGVVRTVGLDAEVLGGSPFHTVISIGDAFLVAGESARIVPRTPGVDVVDLEMPLSGGSLPSARPDAFWTVDPRFDVELVERTLEGQTGRRLVLPGESGPVLPLGDGFLISPAGSIMLVDATTGRAEGLGEGTAVASDGRTLVRSACGEDLECGLVLSDLDGGNERWVGPPTPRSRYETYSGARFSPDGRWLSIPFYGEDQPGGLVLIDVERGERRPTDLLTTASGGGFPASAAFTADSRWLLFADRSSGATLKAVDMADGTVVPVDLGPAVTGGDGRSDVVLAAFPSIPADAAEPGG